MSSLGIERTNFKTVPEWSVAHVQRDDNSNGQYTAFAFADQNDRRRDRDKVKLARDDEHREWLEEESRGWTQIVSWINKIADHTHYYLHLLKNGPTGKRRMWMIVLQTRSRPRTYRHTCVCEAQLDRMQLPPSSFASLTALTYSTDCSPQRSTAAPHSASGYLRRGSRSRLSTPPCGPLSRQSSVEIAEFQSFCRPNDTSVDINPALISPSASPEPPAILPELVVNRTCATLVTETPAMSTATHELQPQRSNDSNGMSGTSMIIGIVCLVMLSIIIAGAVYILQLKQRMSRLKRVSANKPAESGSGNEGAIEIKYGLQAVEFFTDGEGLENKDVVERVRAISKVTMGDESDPERQLSNELFAEHTKETCDAIRIYVADEKEMKDAVD